MKYLLILTVGILCSFAYASTTNDDMFDGKSMVFENHTAGNMKLETSNYGYFRNLTFPAYAPFLMVAESGTWISAKRYRRDSLGNLLYWLAQVPSAEHDTLVTADDPLWNSGLMAATDTLTSVAIEGDTNLCELLPAYNPLAYTNPFFSVYNLQDRVLKSILGFPAPRQFSIPDPQESYCFSIPQTSAFNTPGLETLSAYYYDYCPLGTPGDRDWGCDSYHQTHIPLGLAIHRESYAWSLQGFDDFIVIKNIIYNTSDIDTLFDIAISEFVDCDIKPVSTGIEGVHNDKSGYIKGVYEFAYSMSFDAYTDTMLVCNYVGNKIIIPVINVNHHGWFWKKGQCPDDSNPRNLNPSHSTANEKYWLATGRNPNTSYFTPLRPEANDQTEWEQSNPTDTRFLNTVYGNLPTASTPNPEGRLNIAPSSNLTYYSVFFTGNSKPILKSKCLAIESFINGGMQMGDTTGLTCLPYFYEPTVELPSNFHMAWQSYTD
ncbi:MAG: hypothetical protein PHO32_05115, partial [Candidatus Cloacimonetes bacterium]|nr:hypothetical protein [Candidatus Cloacimonadota bacterium]